VRGQRHAPAAFYPGKDPVPIVQEAWWAPGLVWTGAENFAPTGIRSPDRPAHSQSLYRLSYPAHMCLVRSTNKRVSCYVVFSSHLSPHLAPLAPKYRPQLCILAHLRLYSFLGVRVQASRAYKTTGKIIFLYTCTLYFWAEIAVSNLWIYRFAFLHPMYTDFVVSLYSRLSTRLNGLSQLSCFVSSSAV
jgi:hypothetical protein